MDESLESPGDTGGAPTASAGARVAGLLTSFRFALAVVTLLALACIVGTVMPQGDQVARYLARHPEAEGRMRWLSALGLTDVFASWWFAVLLGALAASLAACTARRYRAIPRAAGSARIRVIGSFLTHVSMLLILAGGLIRVFLGEKGALELREGETASRFVAQGGPRPLPFAVFLKKFEVEWYKTPGSPAGGAPGRFLVLWPGKDLELEFPVELGKERTVTAPGDGATGTAYRVSLVRYVPDFVIERATGEVVSRSEAPNNPAVLVSVSGGGATHTQWVFARFPDFGSHTPGAGGFPPLRFRFVPAAPEAQAPPSVKAFTSTVTLLEGGVAVRDGTIRVNAPMSHRGYTLYQSGYNPDDPAWTSLQVVHDPGVPVVHAGFVLMMIGLTMVFCVVPWMASERREPGVEA